ncbi:hypothetical protein BDV93DRAFT_506846 [Ceratobasidium sp. AG-I]|nr:hypothetical protein BDV93DRAFT_506846 [Ceratobasidium sp. AG-I]
MPPRKIADSLVLRVKSHKTSVFVTVPKNATVATLKEFVKSAFNAHASPEAERGLPLPINSLEDFIFALRRPSPTGKPTFVEVPEDDASMTLTKRGINNWDAVYIRWYRDGEYQPVEVTLPSLLDAASDDDDENEEEPPSSPPPPPTSSKNKGKGKA